MQLFEIINIAISVAAIALSIYTLYRLTRYNRSSNERYGKSETRYDNLDTAMLEFRRNHDTIIDEINRNYDSLVQDFAKYKLSNSESLREQVSQLKVNDLRVSVSKVEARLDEFSAASKLSLDYILNLKQNVNSSIEQALNTLSDETKLNAERFSQLTNKIDSHIADLWKEIKIKNDEVSKELKSLNSDTTGIFDIISELKINQKDTINSLSFLQTNTDKDKELMLSNVSRIDSELSAIHKDFAQLDNTEKDKELILSNVSRIDGELLAIHKDFAQLEEKLNEAKEQLLSKIDVESRAKLSRLDQEIHGLEAKINQSIDQHVKEYQTTFSDLNNHIESLHLESKEQFSSLQTTYNEFGRISDSFSGKIQSSISSITNTQSDFEQKIDKLETEVMSSLKVIREEIDATSHEMTSELQKYSDKYTESCEQLSERIESEKPRISKALKLGRTSLSGLQLLFKNKRKVDQLADKGTIKDLEPYVNDVAKLGFLNQLAYQRFNRNLDSEATNRILHSFKKQLDLDLSLNKLYYMAHKIWMIEGSCVGRLATNIEDAIVRCLIAYKIASTQREIRGLEIGTLFGINLCCLAELVGNHSKAFHFTIIDPLEGYYSLSPNDIVVDEPINETVFFRNVTRYTQKKNVSLIKKFTNQLTNKNLAQRSFNYVLIDGDHTYDGVKLDFELIKDRVEVGGFVIFDDYDTTDWPDIKTFVDKEVHKLKDYKKVLSLGRSSVYQKL